MKFVLEIRPFGNQCNRFCPHCYQYRKDTKIINELQIDDLNRFIIELKKYLNSEGFTSLKIVFHGGEPLIDEGKWITAAHDMISNHFVDDLHLNFLLHTHGFYSESILTPLIERSIGFGVSFALPNEGQVQIEDIPPAISIIADRHLLYSVQIVMNSKTFIDPLPLSSLFEILPPDLIIKFIPYMGIKKVDNVFLSPELYSKKLIQISQYYEKTVIWNKFFIEPISWCRQASTNNNYEQFKGCRFNAAECNLKNNIFVTAAIDYDGTIYSCNRFAGIQKYPISHINEKNWSKYAQKNIKILNKKYYSFDITMNNCELCNAHFYKLCCGGGGCPFHAIFCHNTNSIDLFCEGEKALAKYYERSIKRNLGETPDS